MNFIAFDDDGDNNNLILKWMSTEVNSPQVYRRVINILLSCVLILFQILPLMLASRKFHSFNACIEISPISSPISHIYIERRVILPMLILKINLIFLDIFEYYLFIECLLTFSTLYTEHKFIAFCCHLLIDRICWPWSSTVFNLLALIPVTGRFIGASLPNFNRYMTKVCWEWFESSTVKSSHAQNTLLYADNLSF